MKYLITLLCVLFIQLGTAQDIADQVTAYANSYASTNDYSGCILITKKGKTIYENCFGKASHSFNISNSKNTKFKIGSVSKQLTAAAILLLEQEGLLKTSDTISKFYPNSTNSQNITIQQLLTHTSGISDIYDISGFNTMSSQKVSIAQLVKLVIERDLNFEPGSQYQYSNGGYAILADIIERVSGATYQTYLKQNIFEPLNMKATGHEKGNLVVPNLAVGYDPLDYNKVKVTDYLDPELLKGSGSLFSTVVDLQTWINSIKEQSLLSKTSYEKLLNNYGNNYGYGISVYNSFDQAVFGHDGRVNGYIADYLHYIDSDITIIILGNIQTGVADFFRRDIAAIVFTKAYKSRAKTIPPEQKSLESQQDILGTYAFGPNFKVYVEEREGSIQARANEGGYSQLIHLQDKRYFSRTLYSYIEFAKDENGMVQKMIWTNNDGNSFEGTKEN